mgnify:CR=1 FL=1
MSSTGHLSELDLLRGQVAALSRELAERNRRLLNYKRIRGYVVWEEDFPRTASLKIKRAVLAEEIKRRLSREAVVAL